MFNLGVTLHSLGRGEEATACHARLHALLVSWGDGLMRESRESEAIDCYRRALVLKPGDADAAYNLGLALHAVGDYAAAIEGYDAALRAAPALGEAALGRALSLLAMGDYARGWEAYECRYTARFERPRAARPDYAFPMWQGEPIAGKRVLLVGEQGYGDQIQFIRYASLLAGQGAAVDVLADAPLERLFAAVPGVRRVRKAVERGAADYDFWSLLLSLPLRLGTRLDSIPAGVPYVRPHPEDVRKWAERLRALPADQPKVGLVWTAGNTSRENLLGRSMPLASLRPLAELSGISFVGLQFGEGGDAGFPMLQLGSEIGDFADQAALLANLDLLVTVDTAAGHLAGALGLPAWILLPATPDWRWLRGRPDSPWYPSVKLLRQAKLGDWAPVVEQVAQDLRTLAARPA